MKLFLGGHESRMIDFIEKQPISAQVQTKGGLQFHKNRYVKISNNIRREGMIPMGYYCCMQS